MDEKICPLRPTWTDIEQNEHESTCIRERCAWWCPALTVQGVQHGSCAITLKALSACVIATYYEKIMDTK